MEAANKNQKAVLNLKKRKILLSIFLIAFITWTPMYSHAQCTGQVGINLDNIKFPGNLWRIEDMLNVEIENRTNVSLDIFLFATVYLENKGDLYEIKSNEFILEPKYFGLINPAGIEPIKVSEMDPDYTDFVQEITARTGSLPAGVYQICIFAYDANTNLCYGTNCISQEIEHPSPPSLIYPGNESILTEELPAFTWLPPMPSTGSINYTLEIVEIVDSQTPIEAMESNSRWFIKTDFEETSFQYPIIEREFVQNSKYAWRIGAQIGPGNADNSYIMSPVWSFTYHGSQISENNDQYTVNLISPENDAKLFDLPFFEWEIKEISALGKGENIHDEEVYFNVSIWEWPDSLIADDAGLIFANQIDYTLTTPLWEVDKLTTSYLNVSQTETNKFKKNHTYLWRVVCIKDENNIAESSFQLFSIFPDNNFIEASERMLNSIKLEDESEIYGLTEAIQAGEIIESEEQSEIDSILVNKISYLFIVDDQPFSRFGHPVRYILVENETKSVNVYSANWFPEVKNSNKSWKSSGMTNVNGTKISLLTSGEESRKTTRTRSIAYEVSKSLLESDCGNYILLIDGGDKNRIGTTPNIASSAARATDAIQKLCESKGYKAIRYSQYWGPINQDIKAIQVDNVKKSGARFIMENLISLKKHYISKECCRNSELEFNLIIYINANAIPSSSKFRIYDSEGSGICENIDYFEDMLKYLQTLPQCVKLTLIIDACYSGSVANHESLDSYLKRGNFEIITSTDGDKTTPSGLNRIASLINSQKIKQKPIRKTDVNSTNKSNAKNPGRNSYTDEIEFALNELKNKPTVQSSDKINFKDKIGEVNSSIKDNYNKSGKTYPNPQYVSVGLRDEFKLQFPVLKSQSKIKECNVIPAKSANIITNKVNGEIILFSKIKGEIIVTTYYENGSVEKKPVTSKWGDNIER